MADDISEANAAQSAQDAASPPDEDSAAPLEHPNLSEELLAELTRFFSLCDAVDVVAYNGDVLNAIADVDFAAVSSHEQATNVDIHTINLDVLNSLDDHDEWLRLTNAALENLPEIHRLTRDVIIREEELTATERNIRDRFGVELVENFQAEMVQRFEEVTRILAFNRNAMFESCRAILAAARDVPASS